MLSFESYKRKQAVGWFNTTRVWDICIWYILFPLLWLSMSCNTCNVLVRPTRRPTQIWLNLQRVHRILPAPLQGPSNMQGIRVNRLHATTEFYVHKHSKYNTADMKRTLGQDPYPQLFTGSRFIVHYLTAWELKGIHGTSHNCKAS